MTIRDGITARSYRFPSLSPPLEGAPCPAGVAPLEGVAPLGGRDDVWGRDDVLGRNPVCGREEVSAGLYAALFPSKGGRASGARCPR